jgi:ferric-dicitrate binding protein FerR (iron transport regulator)
MNPSPRMDGGGFERLLELYGARLERWPEELRAHAREWMEQSELARSAWQEAARLDRLLDAYPEIEPSPALVARIAAIPITAPAPRPAVSWPLGALWASLLGWGVAAVLGLMVGGVAAPMFEPLETGASASVAMSEESEQDDAAGLDEWSELSELAFGAGLIGEEE